MHWASPHLTSDWCLNSREEKNANIFKGEVYTNIRSAYTFSKEWEMARVTVVSEKLFQAYCFSLKRKMKKQHCLDNSLLRSILATGMRRQALLKKILSVRQQCRTRRE